MIIDFFTRAHTINPSHSRQLSKTETTALIRSKWPPCILVFDTETTEDIEQNLEFGCYRFCELTERGYATREEGIFLADDIDSKVSSVVNRYAAKHTAEIIGDGQAQLQVRSRTNFVENVLWPAFRQGGALVAFNLGFDLSRIATHWHGSKNGNAFTFYLTRYRNKKLSKWEPSRYRPAIRRTSIDSKKSFYSIGFTLGDQQENNEYRNGRFIDVRTFAFALTNRSYSLKTFCKAFDAPPEIKKLKYVRGPVTSKKIRYCRRDVTATLWGLNVLREEYDKHPINLHPDKAYSPVSIAKSYMDAMGIVPPQQKFDIPPEVNGAAMEAFYAGRAETKIRKVKAPVVYLDFTSQYPSANALLRNQEILTAESLSFEDCTREAQALLDSLSLDALFSPATWPELRFFAEIKPDGDILPVRARYDGVTTNIAFNYFTSDQPIFYAGPDLAASKILTGKAPQIEKAFRIVPHGKQAGLKPVALRGELTIDPVRDDFARKVIEVRHKVKKTELGNFLKVLANGGFYGLFVEINPKSREEPVPVRVVTGTETYTSTTTDTEEKGRWYCPIIASLITSAGHLLLAMAERLVTDAGGVWMWADTDALGVVSSEHGGLVECPGGRHRLPDGREAVKAISWEETLKKIVEPFDQLHPYDRFLVRDHFLKLEDVNCDSDGNQRQLYGFALSSKRYVLFTESGDGERKIIKPSGHGLGYLIPPFDDPEEDREKEGREFHLMNYQAWEWLLARELDGGKAVARLRKKWFDFPAMMQLAITTPHVIKRLRRMPWARPMNFMQAPVIASVMRPTGVRHDALTLIGPRTNEASTWEDLTYYNLHNGDPFKLLKTNQREGPNRVVARGYASILDAYRYHPELKFLGPDGRPSGMETRGLLQRMVIHGEGKQPIRKESNRRWAEGDDASLLTGDGNEELDSTGAVFKRDGGRKYHHSLSPVASEIREWLKTVRLASIEKIFRLRRQVLRAARDGKPVQQRIRKKLSVLYKLSVLRGVQL
jgi:hypothetical protein